ncbi:pro-adrenomedullin [Gopherus flavomarginatus]|uniref:pro-adrenomedullin n=1 Tax=Gopherus flavomarginatus TaxID=286002 RepID=UPI0021CC3562|nr:pro-adrenomedullin [Gopherus flavomarginatus]
MKLVHVALLYLGSATFLGVHAARLDISSDFKTKWTKWALSRAKRDATPPGTFSGQVAAANVQPLIRSQDVKEDPRVSHPSSPEDARIRVKRYRQSMNGFPHFQAMRLGCRFGTCTIQQLAHQIYQLTDKDKDGAAPVNKISPLGYGRRRRSVPAPSRTQSPWLALLSSRRDSTSAAAPAQPGRLQAQLRAPSLRT